MQTPSDHSMDTMEAHIKNLTKEIKELPDVIGAKRSAFYIVAAMATVGCITGPLALWRIDHGMRQEVKQENHFERPSTQEELADDWVREHTEQDQPGEQ